MLDVRRDRKDIGQPPLMQRQEDVNRRFVALPHRRGRVTGHHRLVAEVLDDQQPLVEIGMMDARRREAVFVQTVRHRHIGNDAFSKVRNCAVGLSVTHRRSIGLAR